MTTHSLPLIIRALGRGKKGTRHLSFDESYFTMQSILTDSITGPQLGAFLMLMRVKEETSEEIAGMVRAAEDHLGYAPHQPIDINWPAYAGKKKQPSWYLLAAKLLANNGYKILIHGGGEHTEGRQYARAACQALSIKVCSTLADAEATITANNIAYISLDNFLPVLSKLIDMKAELGLRSPINTLVRHLNPLQAKTTLQGMFHPSYLNLHHDSALKLEQKNNIVVKGDGGEFEIRPDTDTRFATTSGKPDDSQIYPPTLGHRSLRPETVDIEPVIQLWNGTKQNEYGTAALIETASLILSQHQSIDIDAAKSTVENWWADRTDLISDHNTQSLSKH